MMRTEASELLRRMQMALTLPVLIDLFVETKRVEGRSPKTCSWYRNMLSRFARFVDEDTTLE
jgi:hypothetical protein